MQKKELDQKVSELFDGCTITNPTEDEIIISGGGLPEECSVRDRKTEGISVSFFNTNSKRQQEIKYIYSWTDAYELLYMGLARPDRLADYDGTNVNTLLGREPYDFKWLPEGDIVDIDDHTLKNVIEVVKHGFVVNLFYNEGEIIVEGYTSVYEADLKSRVSWRRMVVNLLRKEQQKANGELIRTDNCYFDPEDALFEAADTPEDAGPDRNSLFGICGFLEYAYRNGDLPDLLAERDRIRKDYRVPNGPYAFTWDAQGGLTTIPESVYQLARQIYRAGLANAEKELNSHNCITIKAPDFNASTEKMTGSQEQTFSAMAATVEEWNTKEGKKKHKNDPYKTYRTPIGDPLFKGDENTSSVYDSVYIIAGYLQYLKDCGGDFHQLIETDRIWYWQNREISDQAWGEDAMHISLRTDMFGYVTDQDLELAGRLQERNYVSLYPNVVSGEKENKIYYAVWASEAVVNWSGDEGQFLTVVKKDKIKHAPVTRLLMTDEFAQEQSGQVSGNVRYIALAAYVDYLHKTGQYQQYLQYRSQSTLLKEYPSLSRKAALADPESDQSLYCIIQGGDYDARERIVKGIAEILFQQGKINERKPVKYTFKDLAKILYGEDIVNLGHFDNDKIVAAFDNPNELEKGKLYVLTHPELCDPTKNMNRQSYSGWEIMVLDYLQDYQPGCYYIVICQSGIYNKEDFIKLRPEFEFLFKDAEIVIDREDPEILYQEFTKQLNEEIKKQLPDTQFEEAFVRYVRDNRLALNMGDQMLTQYLATYVNFEGRLTLPDYEPYTQSNMKEDVIGKGKGNLWKVMDQLRAYVDFLKRAEQEHMDIPPYYWNMIFVGNPGTGKTLMAQYVALLLWQYGVIKYRKSIAFISFNNLLNNPDAISGGIFEEEGLAIVIEDVCNNGNDKSFIPALEQIVIHMEQFKGRQAIILTGTPEGIEEARKVCTKLSTRVNHIFRFEDYSTAEMTQMFFIEMKNSGFVYKPTEEKALNDKIQDLCDHFGHRRNNGNGRFVARLVDQTIMNHAQRVPDKEDTRMFTVMDIPMARDLGFEPEPEDYEQTLDRFVGMESVKKKVKEIAIYVEQQRKIQKLAEESKQNIKTRPTCMHMVFEGNPGTGKTTIARVMADIFYSAGVLKTNHFTEVGREDLVGQYIGHTEQKTKAVIQEALDGVLLVDEAYTLVNYEGTSTKDFGREAIGVLLRAMEDYKDCLVIIFAGYTDEMRRFIDGNPGIASRIAYTINFSDYTAKELTEMFRKKMKEDGYIIEKEQGKNVLDKVKILCEYFSRRRNFGNGRFIDKLMQETRIRHANNMAKMDKDFEESEGDEKTNDIVDVEAAKNAYEKSMTLSEDDIPSIQAMAGGAGEEEPEGKADNLDNIIGLEKVKEQFRNFEKVVNYQKEGRERGVTIPDFHLHMVFRGDPGTGKTIMARQVKDVLYQIGIIKENKLVEVLGNDLLGLCVGGQKTKAEDQIEKAMGGVLFIDEAYSLAYGKGSGSVEDAVATLVKAMEDHKDDLVIIFAGYAEEMDNFISMNPGLSSRIGFTFTFDNYSADELTEMFAKKMKRNGFIVSSKARENVTEVVEYFRALPGFGNGRFVDRLIQTTITNRARRYGSKTPGAFQYINAVDIPSVQDMGGRELDVEEEEKLHKERVACHEAGHALVSKILEPDKELAEITIHRNAISYGYVASEEPHYSDMTETALKCQLATYFGGRNAENLVYGDHDPGCQADMNMAIDLAQRMVNEYAMGIFGKTTPMDLLHEADRTATTVLENYKGELCQIQDFLLSKGNEVISGEEFEKFYQGIHKEIEI